MHGKRVSQIAEDRPRRSKIASDVCWKHHLCKLAIYGDDRFDDFSTSNARASSCSVRMLKGRLATLECILVSS